jgi:hypothetical protein
MKINRKCFVISAIGEPGSKERRHSDLVLNYIIKTVVEGDYEVTRGDHVSQSGSITVDVINRVSQSDLVIADLTFLNPNVFYELGIRHNVKMPTGHMASHDTKLPFDTSDHRVIVYDIGNYDSHVEARNRLSEAIKAVNEPLFTVTNPVTIAEAHRENGRTREMLGDIRRTINDLENGVNALLQEPPAGHVRRDYFKEKMAAYHSEISDIVRSIRIRMDRPDAQLPENRNDVRDVLQRLDRIEQIILPRVRPNENGEIAMPPESQTPEGQSIN